MRLNNLHSKIAYYVLVLATRDYDYNFKANSFKHLIKL